MSKRNSSGGANTLFNYFVKSPNSNSPKPLAPVNRKNECSSPSISEPNEKIKRKAEDPKPVCSDSESDGDNKIIKKPRFNSESDEDNDVPVTSRRKRIRLVSEYSDEENSADVSSIKEKLENSFKFEAKTTSSSSPASTKKNKKDKLNETKEDNAENISEGNEPNNWLHCRLDWLKPDKIRDANKRRPDHPDYDPKTLFVPEDFRKTQTPAHKQWWEIKSSHYDCVLFFKVGKFYELFHMDAAVGVNELGFSYMKGDYAHSGFPESAYARMSSSLVQKGYKVARVEQTETPEMMQERSKKLPSKEKVVKREICQVTCKGAEICNLVDSGPVEASASYMLAIAEQVGPNNSVYGVCFVDTSIGEFKLGQFEDDRYSSRLLTTLAHYPPSLILNEKSHISDRTSKILRMSCQAARRETLVPEKEFWTPEKTLKTLSSKYSGDGSSKKWSEELNFALHDGDMLGFTPAENYSLAVKALGACISYLTNCLLDIQVMEMARFVEYHPPNVFETPKDVKSETLPTNMVLDAYTLMNLHITGDDASLVSKLNHCTTAMGKRLLHQWVCSPSCQVEIIKERQNAISYLLETQSTVQEVRATLNGLPDMERLFTKIHTLGNLNRSKNHPDSRAILYEMKTYSKRKVMDFIAILNGFQSITNIMKRFQDTDSSLLKRITQMAPEGQFPDYSKVIEFFKGAFDHAQAEKEGTILPEKGVDLEYDEAVKQIDKIKSDLDAYLRTQEKYFHCKVSYFGSDKKRYQLEVVESKSNRADEDYNLEGARKGFKRYSTAETREMLSRMLAAEENLDRVLKDLSRRIFENFSQSHNLWLKAIHCVSILDVLISLAEYTRLQSCEMCIPQFASASDTKPFIVIKDGRHPCIGTSDGRSMDDYIPNDTELGVEDNASLVLLTGPNMGGKSTLMRQLGLLTIMAQIGCHIPASECSLTIVDRIFTRLGARDDIMTGQSTFLVELSETSAILKHATLHSLILLDELGRGTSTYDGTAIAAAVLDDLCNRKCRTIFSTHYHTLVEDFRNNPQVALAHMSCMVETEESTTDEADDITQETVTFMYKLTPGACPKSYGFNAARLAGINKAIIKRAHQIAMEMEREAKLVTMFKRLTSKTGGEKCGLKELLKACRTIDF